MNYRADIDALRAVAVVVVLFFHVQVPGFSGGFVGVDVFFVISGFLVTTIIKTKLEAGNFHLGAFWLSRVWRLVPALVVVATASWIVAVFEFSPFHLQRFSGEYLSALVSVSNFFFWSESGYFDADKHVKPLLHTWTLGLEVQYYLILPVVMWALYRLGSIWVVVGCTILAIASIGISGIWQLGETSSFFLLPARFNEFMIGGILAWVPQMQMRKSVANALCTVGVGLVASAVLTYDENLVFPGFAALVPCSGAALAIFAGSKSSLAALSKQNPIVRLGLISYSLYLVHWPIVVFYTYRTGTDLNLLASATIIILSLALAAVLYLVIETPFRTKRLAALPPALLARASIVFLSISAVVGSAHAFTSGGWSWRLPSDLRELAASADNANLEAHGECRLRFRDLTTEAEDKLKDCYYRYGPAVLIIGDSHAFDLIGAMSAAANRAHIVGIARGGCRAHTDRPPCQFSDIAKFVQRNAELVEAVFYTQSGTYFLSGLERTLPIMNGRINAVVRYLEGLSASAEVYWFGPQWEHNIDLKKGVRSVKWLSQELPRSNNWHVREVDEALASALAGSKIHYVSKISTLGDMTIDKLVVDGRLTYSDGDHWSAHGEKLFGPKLIQSYPEVHRLLR